MNSGLLTILSGMIRDTEEIELHVGKTLGIEESCRFNNRYYSCILPSEEVPSRGDYHNLLVRLSVGSPVRWQPDILILETFREELEKYKASLKGSGKRQNNSPNRSSHIRLMEE